MNKRGVAPLFIILIIGCVLIGIYLFLYLPIPAFTSLRTLINYVLILIVFILLQVGLIFAYYTVIKFVLRLITSSKNKLNRFAVTMRKILVSHT